MEGSKGDVFQGVEKTGRVFEVIRKVRHLVQGVDPVQGRRSYGSVPGVVQGQLLVSPLTRGVPEPVRPFSEVDFLPGLHSPCHR